MLSYQSKITAEASVSNLTIGGYDNPSLAEQTFVGFGKSPKQAREQAWMKFWAWKTLSARTNILTSLVAEHVTFGAKTLYHRVYTQMSDSFYSRLYWKRHAGCAFDGANPMDVDYIFEATRRVPARKLHRRWARQQRRAYERVWGSVDAEPEYD